MTKKRKKVEKLKYTKLDKSQEACPVCFGNKHPYCRKDLCGKWFEGCKEADDQTDKS
jgi:hypothetical protein